MRSSSTQSVAKIPPAARKSVVPVMGTLLDFRLGMREAADGIGCHGVEVLASARASSRPQCAGLQNRARSFVTCASAKTFGRQRDFGKDKI